MRKQLCPSKSRDNSVLYSQEMKKQLVREEFLDIGLTLNHVCLILCFVSEHYLKHNVDQQNLSFSLLLYFCFKIKRSLLHFKEML